MKEDSIREKVAALLEKKNWTTEEREWLLSYLEHTDHTALKALMQAAFISAEQEPLQDSAHKLLARLRTTIDAEPVIIKRGYFRRNAGRLSVAACFLLFISVACFAWLSNIATEMPVDSGQAKIQSTDIRPGKNNAVLTLADGSTIMLDSTANGTLAKQSGISITKKDGTLLYSGKANGEVIYNSIATAKGNQYQLTLSDGSKVWLNAVSSLRFPAAFAASERRVEVAGEAYFEITKNAAKPFIVVWKTRSGTAGEIRVLGTHFNINAYADEDEVKTTLAEGKVIMVYGNQSVPLQPGHEAVLSEKDHKLTTQPGNVEQAVAWKEGSFEFHDTPLDNIMRQLNRWYDIEVVVADEIKRKTFNGSIRREATLAQALQILELAGIHWSIEGKVLKIGRAPAS